MRHLVVPVLFAATSLLALAAGTFEQGGRPVATGVRFKVGSVVHEHVLNGSAPPSDLSYLVFGRRSHAFLVHFIASAPSFDEVLATELGPDAPSDADLARGIVARAVATPDVQPSRLGLAPNASRRTTLTRENQAFVVGPVTELSCLVGPDFTDDCH